MSTAPVGISAWGVAVPRRRLDNGVLARAWGRPPSPGVRAVPGPDEDSLTLGVEAALGALDRWEAASGTASSGRAAVGAVLLATTTPSLAEGSLAGLLAEVCRLPETVRTVDLGHSGRGGLTALALAADLAPSVGPVLVVAADTRRAAPGSDLEPLVGAGAAACVVESGDGVGWALVRRAGRASPLAPSWRLAGEKHAQWADLRFGRTVLYGEAVDAVLGVLLEGVDGERLAGIALQAPDPGSGVRALARAGLDPRRHYRDHVSPKTGDTGCAHPLLMAAAAAERLETGALLAVLAAADGVEAVLLECRRPTPAGAARALARSLPLESVVRALDLAGEVAGRPADPLGFRSEVLDWRERGPTWRLVGTRCAACDATFALAPRACQRCGGATDDRPLARAGTVFSWTREHYVPTPEPPGGMVVVDLDGGGRLTVPLADPEGEPEVGDRVELVLRRLHEIAGRPGYAWKARPASAGGEGGSADAR
ncbi:OB-fold domain-containing protein [Myxococcota bacterium]|nr:OB-fold domain-containing protein [Myxococcota bacterium]